ncbi:conserved hypothetical protein [Thermoplasma acidophilum]|uniref:Alkyl hydroperoxide reductase subunit C/ Thiol specific antioxidant domain-containing protein n=1 Tax=Thermoplasma acidophilum (strain ATCC 25905 / DSM 1728 / JCM 9062 / NBRC 15155 / AMRC-C165) TaxID=273075 RepID=Q9HIH1_THEAC|nr:conserved hypothetical protein [Thermoplasma acidophilum]
MRNVNCPCQPIVAFWAKRGNVMAVKVGDKAPDFEAPDTNLKMRKLSDFKGQKVVLAFFPGALQASAPRRCARSEIQWQTSTRSTQRSSA